MRAYDLGGLFKRVRGSSLIENLLEQGVEVTDRRVIPRHGVRHLRGQTVDQRLNELARIFVLGDRVAEVDDRQWRVVAENDFTIHFPTPDGVYRGGVNLEDSDIVFRELKLVGETTDRGISEFDEFLSPLE